MGRAAEAAALRPRPTVESDPRELAKGLDMNDYIVETEGLTKRFGGRVAVDGVDLRIPRGSAFGYLGPNGAGKTTLIRMLLGLTRPTLRLDAAARPAGARRAGRGARPRRRDRRGAALPPVPDRPREPRDHRCGTRRRGVRRIDGALERVGLAARADERVKKYSLGMRQRLGVARALLGDPELLILDEPTNGLDPAGILEFRGLVRRLVGEGRTVVLSSHLLDEVEKICDAVAIVDRGSVVWQGPIDAIRSGGRRTLLVDVDDVAAALALLGDHAVEATPDGLARRTPGRRTPTRRRGGDQPHARRRRHRRPSPRAFPGLARGAVPGDHVPIGGSSMNLDPRRAPEAAEAARARRGRGRRDDRPRRRSATPSSRSCTRRIRRSTTRRAGSTTSPPRSS